MKNRPETRKEIMNRVIVKAWTDPRYLENIQSDPKSVLEKEGMKFKKGAKVTVSVESEKNRHFVIPAPPAQIDFSRDEILRLAADRLQVVTQRG